ncbi:MAG: alkaline phosphatase D family protein [Planctomycetota bacterium]|jgi:alkaline phosphatase D
MKKTVILSLAAVALLAAAEVRAGEAGKKPKKKRDAAAGNLKLLNQWGQQPEALQRVFTAATKLLVADEKASFGELAGNAEFQRLCAEAGVTHLGGPMLGCVGPDGARVWLRTVRPAKVEVQVGGKSYGPISSTAETGLTAIVPVTGLKPGTSHPYRVLVDGKPIAVPEGAAITTTPGKAEPAKVRIAFGSCQHRWGLGNGKQADAVRGRKPAAMLLIGDVAVQDRDAHRGLHRADYLLRDFFPAWRKLSSAIPVYATWDDHDYSKKDRAGIDGRFTEEDRRAITKIFSNSWNNPGYGFGEEGGGVFLRTRIGPCDVIMVDNRSFRHRKKKWFLGEPQMKWLEAELQKCKGPFIIMSCGTMWSDYVSNGKDSWGRWDQPGRERIFSLIEKNRIGGVLLISGDRHGARAFRIPRPSGFNFYEFGAASLGGRGGPKATMPEWKTQIFGVSNKYAFGEFSIDATLADPEVVFRLVLEDGSIHHELKLKRSELTPPPGGKQ